MTINSAGFVGIGKTAPTSVLDVLSPHNIDDIARFMVRDKRDGVAIGWSGIWGIGSIADRNFKISARGTGKIDLNASVVIRTLPAGAAADAI